MKAPKAVIAFIFFLFGACAPMPFQYKQTESSQSSGSELDGVWSTEEEFYPPDAWGWEFRISDNVGTLTKSYRPRETRKKPGNIVMNITRKSRSAFSGNYTCYDGNSYPVTGRLLPGDRLDMQLLSGRCYPRRWTMVRKSAFHVAFIEVAVNLENVRLPILGPGDAAVAGHAWIIAVDLQNRKAQSYGTYPDPYSGLIRNNDLKERKYASRLMFVTQEQMDRLSKVVDDYEHKGKDA